MSEILFLATYPELAEVAQEICAGTDDVTIEVARMDAAVKRSWEAQKEGYSVLVSRGVTTWKIRSSGIDLPVVDVSIGGYDIVRAYFEAKKIGNKIGIVDVEEVILGIDGFEEIIGDKIEKYVCSNDLDDIHKGVAYLRARGVEVVMGKVAMANEAKRQGMDSVVITSGIDSVRRAIYEARRVNIVRKQEMRKAEQFKAILNFTYDGIIALDKEGKITVFNKTSEKISGWKAERAIGAHITDVIPKAHCHKLLETGEPEIGEFLEIGDSRVIANRVPIIVDNKVEGVVTTFQEIERIKRIEGKVRRQLAEKGFIAKYTFNSILGESPAIKNAISLAKEYASVDSTVMIYGPTGAGKEMFAHAIHNASKRKNEPFVAVNCAALPENLLESELFGYVEGAFTGARKEGKVGMFEMAHRGTLFLDEVGEMSPRLQSRLLRVIEQGEVMRLGDNSIIPVDVRLIAATHRNLKQMMGKNEFREDLFYRINVLSLKLPSLKERGKDIIQIAKKYLDEFCARRGKPTGVFSEEAEKLLLNYNWPGNLRELRNVMERLAMRPWKKIISSEDISSVLLLDEEHSLKQEGTYGQGQRTAFDRNNLIDKQTIKQVLEETRGNKTEAARRLGISRTTLWRKLRE
ncbi:MAG TPA: sigma 54-interacting transcriptional regulator [Peptococcaceae bacterium]|nr:sigma 54-interacting transcriptional regulator [Peptococcaceae bacterium]